MGTGRDGQHTAGEAPGHHVDGILEVLRSLLRRDEGGPPAAEPDLRVARARGLLEDWLTSADSGTDGPRTGSTPPPEVTEEVSAALFEAAGTFLLSRPSGPLLPTAEAVALLTLLHRRLSAAQSPAALSVPAAAGHAAPDLPGLIDRIHTAYQRERLDLSRDLHDEVAGHLGAALNWLELCRVHAQSSPGESRRKLAAAERAVHEALTGLRGAMVGLRSGAGGGSLREMVADEVTREAEAATVHAAGRGPGTRVCVTGDESRLSPALRAQIHLVLREAWRNAFRHARAASVNVDVRIDPDQVRGTVADDGVGFCPTASPADRCGLRSMAERTELLGGKLELVSKPGRGTTVRLVIPLRRDTDGDRG